MSAGVRVLLVGATGLVGRHCLARLQGEVRVTEIVVLQRAPTTMQTEQRTTRQQVDFEQLAALPESAFKVDAVICALGTTIRTAGSQTAFRRVDHDYPIEIAHRAHAAGATRFGLVSAIGADAASRVFYNRVKGEVEDAIEALGFESLAIVRPSLLLGERAEHRLGEKLSAPLMRVLPRRWRAVPASNVAQALVDAVLAGHAGTHRIENAALLQG
ncbi:MAG: NAD(P)H-binding protein [Chiayiivirga sp.]|jgi:uncharacterized protein YbjT (DUF2867 family)|uniref:NAD(P)H-binding protein n=1 Tax=Chiayiivirga sp. TaxID=2041042 RepID=UPI0025B85E20|nr:NAD(P)H-binding protein [Chiayiivirga sp.]MCI1711058.1 NAD(P)H-binding protein [Chiayiivirga sp.]MCI1728124.1 NAD(P)H-binding protein [Chiayiivirga sp.]